MNILRRRISTKIGLIVIISLSFLTLLLIYIQWDFPEIISATELPPKKLNYKSCISDEDCVVFGKDGECNCGCFNKNYKWESGGDCFCAAPISCKCIEGKCESVF